MNHGSGNEERFNQLVDKLTTGLTKIKQNNNINIKIKSNIDKTAEEMDKLNRQCDELNEFSKYYQNKNNALAKMIDGWNGLLNNNQGKKLNELVTFDNQDSKEVYRLAEAYQALGGDLEKISPEIVSFVEQMRDINSDLIFKPENFTASFERIKNLLRDELVEIESMEKMDLKIPEVKFIDPDSIQKTNQQSKEFADTAQKTGQQAGQSYDNMAKAAEESAKRQEEAAKRGLAALENLQKARQEVEEERARYWSDSDYNSNTSNSFRIRLNEYKTEEEKIQHLIDLQEGLIQKRKNNDTSYYENAYKSEYANGNLKEAESYLEYFKAELQEYNDLTAQIDYVSDRLIQLRQEFVQNNPISETWDQKNIQILIESIRLLIQHVEKLSQSFGSLDKEKGITNLLSQLNDIQSKIPETFNGEDLSGFKDVITALSDSISKIDLDKIALDISSIATSFGRISEESGLTPLLSQFKDLTQNMEAAKGDEKNLFNPEDVEQFSRYLSDILIKIGEISEQLREIGFANFFTNNAVVELKDILSQFKAESFVGFKNNLSEIVNKFEELKPLVSDMVTKLGNLKIQFNLGEESDIEKYYRKNIGRYESFYNDLMKIAQEASNKMATGVSGQEFLFSGLANSRIISSEYGDYDSLKNVFGKIKMEDTSKTAEQRFVNYQRFIEMLETYIGTIEDKISKAIPEIDRLKSLEQRATELLQSEDNTNLRNAILEYFKDKDGEVSNVLQNSSLEDLRMVLDTDTKSLKNTITVLETNEGLWNEINSMIQRRRITSNVKDVRSRAMNYDTDVELEKTVKRHQMLTEALAKSQEERDIILQREIKVPKGEENADLVSMAEKEVAALDKEIKKEQQAKQTREQLKESIASMASDSQGNAEILAKIIEEIVNVTNAITGLQETLKKGLGIKDEEGTLSFFETLQKKFDEIAGSSERLQDAFASLVGLIGADKTDLIGIKPETVNTVTQSFTLLRNVLQEIYSLQKELGVSAKDVAKAESEAVANSTTASGKPKKERKPRTKKQETTKETTATTGVGDEVQQQADKVSAGINKIKEQTEELKQLRTEINNVIGWDSTGEQVDEGVIKGVEKKAGEVKETIEKAIAKDPKEQVETDLGIKSPSRVFMEIGEFCVKGFVIGIQEGAPKIAEVLKNTFDVNKYLKEIISSSSVESVANQLFSHITGKYDVGDENALKENIMSYVNLLNSKTTKTALKNSIGTIGESLPIKSALETKQRELTEMLNNSTELSADDQNILQKELQETTNQLTSMTSALDKLDQMFKEVGNDEDMFVTSLSGLSVKDLQQMVKDLGASYQGKLDHISQGELAKIVANGYGTTTGAFQIPKEEIIASQDAIQQEQKETNDVLNVGNKDVQNLAKTIREEFGLSVGSVTRLREEIVELLKSIQNGESISTDFLNNILYSDKNIKQSFNSGNIGSQIRSMLSTNKIKNLPEYKSEFGDDWNNVKKTIGFNAITNKGGSDIFQVINDINSALGNVINIEGVVNNADALRVLFETIASYDDSVENYVNQLIRAGEIDFSKVISQVETLSSKLLPGMKVNWGNELEDRLLGIPSTDDGTTNTINNNNELQQEMHETSEAATGVGTSVQSSMQIASESTDKFQNSIKNALALLKQYYHEKVLYNAYYTSDAFLDEQDKMHNPKFMNKTMQKEFFNKLPSGESEIRKYLESKLNGNYYNDVVNIIGASSFFNDSNTDPETLLYSPLRTKGLKAKASEFASVIDEYKHIWQDAFSHMEDIREKLIPIIDEIADAMNVKIDTDKLINNIVGKTKFLKEDNFKDAINKYKTEIAETQETNALTQARQQLIAVGITDEKHADNVMSNTTVIENENRAARESAGIMLERAKATETTTNAINGLIQAEKEETNAADSVIAHNGVEVVGVGQATGDFINAEQANDQTVNQQLTTLEKLRSFIANDIPSAIDEKDSKFNEELQIVIDVIEKELQELEKLRLFLYNDIPLAITEKNTAFQDELSLVTQVVNDEIEQFKRLSQQISGQLENGISNIDPEKIRAAFEQVLSQSFDFTNIIPERFYEGINAINVEELRSAINMVFSSIMNQVGDQFVNFGETAGNRYAEGFKNAQENIKSSIESAVGGISNTGATQDFEKAVVGETELSERNMQALTQFLSLVEKVKSSIGTLYQGIGEGQSVALEDINALIQKLESGRQFISGTNNVDAINQYNQALEYLYQTRTKIAGLGSETLGFSSAEYQSTLQMITELRVQIEEMRTALQSGNTVEMQTEIQFFKNLEKVLKEDIPAAIRTKNARFLEEEKIVGQVVGKEIAAFKHLEEELSRNLTNAISNGFDAKSLESLGRTFETFNTMLNTQSITAFTTELTTLYNGLEQFLGLKAGDNHVFDSLLQMLDKGDELKSLADVLKATEEKLKAAQDSLANGQNSDIDNTTNSVGRLDSAIKQLGIPENEWEYWIEDLDDIEKRLGRILKITASTRLINKKDAEGNDLLDDSGNPVQERIYTGVTVYGREGTGTYNVKRSEDGRLAMSERSIKETPYDAIHDLEVENRLSYLDTLEKNLEKSNAMTEELRKSLQELRNEAQNSNPSAQADPYKAMLEGFNREYKDAIAQAKELEKQNQETYKNELALIKANYDAKTEYNTIKANNLVNPDLTSDDKVVRANEQVISTTNDAAEAVQRLGQMFLDESISAAEYLKAVDMYRSEGSKSSVEKLEKAEYTAAENKKKADTEEYNAQVKAIEDMITAQSKLNDMKAKQISGKDQSIVMAEQFEKVKVAATEAEDAVYHLFDMFNEGKISETQLDDALEKFDFGIGGNAQSKQNIGNSMAGQYNKALEKISEYEKKVKAVQDLQDSHSSGSQMSGRITSAITKMDDAYKEAYKSVEHLQGLLDKGFQIPGVDNIEKLKDSLNAVLEIGNAVKEVNFFDKDFGFETAERGYETLIKNANRYYSIILKIESGGTLTANEYSFLDRLAERYKDATKEAEIFNTQQLKIRATVKGVKTGEFTEDAKAAQRELENIERLRKELNEAERSAQKNARMARFDKITDKLTDLGNKEGSQQFNVELDQLKKEYTDLQKVIKDIDWNGSSEEQLKETEQQVDQAMAKIEKSMAKLGSGSEYQKVNELQRDTLIRRIAEWQNNNQAAGEFNKQLDVLKEQLRTIDDQGSLNRIAGEFENIRQKANEAGKTGQTFAQKLRTSFNNLTRYLMTFASFYRIIGTIKQAVNIVKELDDAMVEIRKVTSASASELERFSKDSFDMASKFGTTAKQIQESTSAWLRLGEDFKTATESAQMSTFLLNTTEISSIDEATEDLVSISQAYKEISKSDIIDKLNNIGDHFSSSSSDLAQGMKNAAAVLKTQKNDIDKTLSLLVAGVKMPVGYGNIFHSTHLNALIA